MAGPEWDRKIQEAFERITGLDDADLARLHNDSGRRFTGADANMFKEGFSSAFFQYASDPNNELSPSDRQSLRQDIFHYLAQLGFDPKTDFDWQAWRDEMGYNG